MNCCLFYYIVYFIKLFRQMCAVPPERSHTKQCLAFCGTSTSTHFNTQQKENKNLRCERYGLKEYIYIWQFDDYCHIEVNLSFVILVWNGFLFLVTIISEPSNVQNSAISGKSRRTYLCEAYQVEICIQSILLNSG